MLNLPKNKKYLLACSAGGDSMALFHMLLKKEYDFEVAHINYHLRKEADEETKLLKEYTDKYSVKAHILEVEPNTIKGNLEAKCREIRYLFFKKIYQENHFDYLLVAHHQDDKFETYLMQKNRGNIVSYFGIKRINKLYDMKVVRPLLKMSKKSILEYNKNNNVPYKIDSSNLKDDFLRNRIRHQVVEKLSFKERRALEKEISEKNKELLSIKRKLKHIDNRSVEEWLKLSDYELAILLHSLVKKYSKETSISLRQIKEIRKAISSNKANQIIPLKNHLYLIKEYNEIKVSKLDKELSYFYIIEKPSKVNNKHFYLDFTKGGENRHVYSDSYPIIIRNALPNDKIKIKDYFVTARRLFIDWKMPITTRKKWPVIVDNSGSVIYMPRYQKNFTINSDTNFYVK